MKKEHRETVMITLEGLVVTLMSAYATISVGHFFIFSLGIFIGSLLTLAGLWDMLSWKRS